MSQNESDRIIDRTIPVVAMTQPGDGIPADAVIIDTPVLRALVEMARVMNGFIAAAMADGPRGIMFAATLPLSDATLALIGDVDNLAAKVDIMLASQGDPDEALAALIEREGQ